MQHEYLTDLEVAELIRFNSNPVLADAVKKVLFAFINERGTIKKGKKLGNTLYNGALGLVAQSGTGKMVVSNEELGADLRAYYQAVGLLESGFNEISKIKVVKEENNKEVNEAI